MALLLPGGHLGGLGGNAREVGGDGEGVLTPPTVPDGLGFLPDADGFAHYAETRSGTLCRHYAGGLCPLYAGLCRKFLKRRAWRADLHDIRK